MSRRRRQVRPEDDASWVFNEMADVYDARPPYPAALIDAIAGLAGPVGTRVLEVGAGMGHLAIPLARRGLRVVAVEPARRMLERLRRAAEAEAVELGLIHGAAESLPLSEPSFELALIADALHFLDVERAAAELRRVLVPRGVLVVVTCDLAPTPFMRAVRELVDDASDRRPRDTTPALRQLATLTDVHLTPARHFHDETPVGPAQLERILRSVSFIGPAMAGERFAALHRKLQALSDPPTWARTFTLHSGQRHRPIARPERPTRSPPQASPKAPRARPR